VASELKHAARSGRAILAPAFEATRGIKLRSCPFCASDQVGVHIAGDPHVICGNCGAEGPSVERSEWDGRAGHLWNARMGEKS
jgi:hypothetical protein